jgi:hypothetical protein
MQETTVAGAIRERSKTIICSLKVCDTTRQHSMCDLPAGEGGLSLFFFWRESSPPLLFDPGFSAILVSGIRTPS